MAGTNIWLFIQMLANLNLFLNFDCLFFYYIPKEYLFSNEMNISYIRNSSENPTFLVCDSRKFVHKIFVACTQISALCGCPYCFIVLCHCFITLSQSINRPHRPAFCQCATTRNLASELDVLLVEEWDKWWINGRKWNARRCKLGDHTVVQLSSEHRLTPQWRCNCHMG